MEKCEQSKGNVCSLSEPHKARDVANCKQFEAESEYYLLVGTSGIERVDGEDKEVVLASTSYPTDSHLVS